MVAASITVIVGLMMAPPTWPTPGRGPVCGPMLVTKTACRLSLKTIPRGARPLMTNGSHPSARPPTMSSVARAAIVATTWFSVGLPDAMSTTEMSALWMLATYRRVSAVLVAMPRGLTPTSIAADVHRRVAVAAGDVEHQHLVEVLVAQVGARAGAVELDLGAPCGGGRARRARRR